MKTDYIPHSLILSITVGTSNITHDDEEPVLFVITKEGDFETNRITKVDAIGIYGEFEHHQDRWYAYGSAEEVIAKLEQLLSEGYTLGNKSKEKAIEFASRYETIAWNTTEKICAIDSIGTLCDLYPELDNARDITFDITGPKDHLNV